MQERTWGRSGERKRRVIALQGRSMRPSGAGYLLFPPFSLHSPSSSLLPISPAVYEGIQSVSVREPAYAHWGLHTQAHSAKQKQATKTVSVNLWYYIFFYNAHPLHAHWYSYFFTPQHTWLFSLSLIMQTWLTHTQTQKYSKHRHIYRETRTHCERASLMDSEDSNFPSATKDRKPSELNYPCLTHTRQDYKHIHTSTHLDTSSVVIVDMHIHISLHSLNHCGMLRIAQSKSHTQSNWAEH